MLTYLFLPVCFIPLLTLALRISISLLALSLHLSISLIGFYVRISILCLLYPYFYPPAYVCYPAGSVDIFYTLIALYLRIYLYYLLCLYVRISISLLGVCTFFCLLARSVCTFCCDVQLANDRRCSLLLPRQRRYSVSNPVSLVLPPAAPLQTRAPHPAAPGPGSEGLEVCQTRAARPPTSH